MGTYFHHAETTFGGTFFTPPFRSFYSHVVRRGVLRLDGHSLLLLMLQAVAYEYRANPPTSSAKRTFNAFLLINGVLGPLLIATVGMPFTGAGIHGRSPQPRQSGRRGGHRNGRRRGTGSEAIAEKWRNVLLGAALLMLTKTACMPILHAPNRRRGDSTAMHVAVCGSSARCSSCTSSSGPQDCSSR